MAEIFAPPKYERGAGDLPPRGEVRLVQLAVDAGAGAIVLADGVKARRLFQQRTVVRQRFRRERGEVARTGPALQRVLQVVDRVLPISVSGSG
jgi:hypothetical protein